VRLPQKVNTQHNTTREVHIFAGYFKKKLSIGRILDGINDGAQQKQEGKLDQRQTV
jgi:hypothetical protein